MKKQVIAYLHTHWDREWYREFEVFRMRLLRVFDNILGMLENGLIPCFYFDGQVSALEDYLEIRPEKEALVRSLIRNKKLFIGPFYCLVDEFLTDKICFSKNLEIGMKKAIDLGCVDFIGYLPDTFGHSENVPEILREFGIDKAIVWRGCGDFPAEFKWCGMDTVNLVRGYFQDVFSLDSTIEEKAVILKKNLDLISEKSDEYVLLPIGADHLNIPIDINDQILAINEILKDSYEIKLSSPFEYFKLVENNFENFEHNSELRDNSKTFILQGCYSSRLDLKKYNIECSHKLDVATRFVKLQKAEGKYEKLLEYAYKLLLQNQAHDGICGCSTDEVHEENKIRYKKVLQIAETIIDELKFDAGFDSDKILNLAEDSYSGIIELKTTKEMKGLQKISSQKGFDKNLLTNTNKIPITEDYTDIYNFVGEVENIIPDEIDYLLPIASESDLDIGQDFIKNKNIELKIIDGQVYINDTLFSLIDYVDLGDSYNNGPKENDTGSEFKILRSKIITKGYSRCTLRIDFEGAWDIVSLFATLDNNARHLNLNFIWNNSQKNHLLEASFELIETIKEVFSEDMNTLIKRTFDSEYDIRKNLPKERGIEAKTNTAPMQRGLLIDEAYNNIGIITKGLTQYEIYKNMLYIPILRATGSISNPQNPARTTPAGPPIETPNLQMIGKNSAELNVFFGNQNDFKNVLNQVYNYIIV